MSRAWQLENRKGKTERDRCIPKARPSIIGWLQLTAITLLSVKISSQQLERYYAIYPRMADFPLNSSFIDTLLERASKQATSSKRNLIKSPIYIRNASLLLKRNTVYVGTRGLCGEQSLPYLVSKSRYLSINVIARKII